MAEAAEAFRWLREYEYNVDALNKHMPTLRDKLGVAYYKPKEAFDVIDGAEEHIMEMLKALQQLRTLLREDGENRNG